MKPVKLFMVTEESVLAADYEVLAKEAADRFAVDYSDYQCKVYSFLPNERKVVISNSDDTRVIHDDMKHYPLGRRYESFVKTFEITYDTDEVITTFADAVHTATAICDKLMTDNEGYIYVIKLKDNVGSEKDRLIMPSMFHDSIYKTKVSAVDVGDASIGESLIPDFWNIEFNGDGVTI